jgi:hypothetical protein
VKAFVRPRPLRVAYLVSENEHWSVMLDAISDESFARWAGRFFLIIPCVDGSIVSAYLPWLKLYDPDVIYSYVELNDEKLAEIDADLRPSYFVTHDFRHYPEANRHSLRPKLPTPPLTALSVIGRMGRASLGANQNKIALVDTQLNGPPSSLLQQNFGCYGQSLDHWPLDPDIREHVDTLTFVSPEIQNDPRLQPRAQGDLVSTEADLLGAIAERRDLVGMAQLSAIFAPRLEISGAAWSRSATIVVGDTFADRLAFWNGLCLSPVWLGGSLSTLIVSQDDLSDPARFDQIVAIARKRIHFPQSGNAAFTSFVLRSASVAADELTKISARFQASDRFNRYTSEPIGSLETLVPSADALNRARFTDPGAHFQPVDWHETKIQDRTFRPFMALPRHLRDIPLLPGRARAGLWQIDLNIQREVDHSSFQNTQHVWILPRRLRMEGAFAGTYQPARTFPICRSRTTLAGLLSLTGGVNGQLPEITVPTDETVFRHAICAPREISITGRMEAVPKPGLAYQIRPSDKGRYLTALLRMSSTIHRANEIFLSGFWKDQFDRLGATPKITVERVAKVSKQLERRLQGRDPGSADGLQILARLVIAEARNERIPDSYLRFDHLRKRFDEFRAAHGQARPGDEPTEEWLEYETKSLALSTQYLCKQGILHQGYAWRCLQCYNSNWESLEDIKPAIVCEVCGQTEQSPVDHAWHFKLNGFVFRGLQEHGLLPLVWCLGKCAARVNNSFFYLPPHDFYFTPDSYDAGKRDAEVDLLMVCDGEVRMIEAKLSDGRVDITKMVDTAKLLRPDVVVLAVMEEMSDSLKAKLDDLRQQLVGTSIRAELMTLEPDDIETSPKLPTGTSVQWRYI